VLFFAVIPDLIRDPGSSRIYGDGVRLFGNSKSQITELPDFRTPSPQEFKTVVEDFQSDIKKLTEAMQHGFFTVNAKLDSHAEQIA